MIRPVPTAIVLLVAALSAACATSPTRAADGPRGERNGTGETEIKPYAEVVTDEAVSDSGLFVTHRIDEKLLFEIPTSMLGREMIIVSRRARTAADFGYGGMKNNTQTVRWQREGDRILLRVVSHESVADDSLPIYEAVRSASFEPIVASFGIEAMSEDSVSVVVDVTDLLTKDVPMLGVGRSTREEYSVRSLDEDRTFISSVRSFPRNIEIRHVLTYEANEPPSSSSTGTLSLEMNHSMVLLPDDPMQPRLWDERVGYFSIQQVDYGRSEQKVVERRYITRWRLEPSDSAAFRRGELVEPVKPIVYYIDPATPQKWRPYLKQGVEDWQPAFEAAGFRNAIIARDPPSAEEDPEFSPEDVRYSVIRWFPSQVQNAFGPHVHDPRTGEILESDIGWYHNVANLLRNWYLIQTAAANPEARGVEFEDEVMGRLIRFVSAHEVGHTLGLPHNMKASSAYPVDSLRAQGFVCRMGVAPSIMDYARFNYVAQPEDEGACFDPRVGPYDVYSVMWGYRPILEAGSSDDEEEALDAWILERYDDPIYHFGNPSSVDPTSMTEAIGADAMEAGELGIENLKRIVPALVEWAYEPREDYDELAELYAQVAAQWNRYMGHVAANIGGVVRTPKTFDQEGAVYEPVSVEQQRRAMAFLARQAFQPPTWLVDRRILSRIEDAGTVERMRDLQARVLGNVLEPSRMQRLIEGQTMRPDTAYALDDMLDDVRNAVWSELSTGAAVGTYRRNLQRAHVERLEWLMSDEAESDDVDVSQSDIGAVVRGSLEELRVGIDRALVRAPDRITRLHLRDIRERIDRILDPYE
jgi:hypothetical protein